MNKSKSFPWNIDLPSVCDQCGRWRVQGNHAQCSKRRQQQSAQLRAQQKQ